MLSDGYLSWTQAEAYAQSLGGHLVGIDDAAEQQWLTQSFGVFNVWTGLSVSAEADLSHFQVARRHDGEPLLSADKPRRR